MDWQKKVTKAMLAISAKSNLSSNVGPAIFSILYYSLFQYVLYYLEPQIKGKVELQPQYQGILLCYKLIIANLTNKILDNENGLRDKEYCIIVYTLKKGEIWPSTTTRREKEPN